MVKSVRKANAVKICQKKNKKGVEGKALIQSTKYINGKASLVKAISSIQKDCRALQNVTYIMFICKW